MDKPGKLVMVIFGASGDLTCRKLIPALYTLYNQQMMPANFHILGVSRTLITDGAFKMKMEDGIRRFSEKAHLNEREVSEFVSHLSYLSMDMSDPSEYDRLKTVLAETDQAAGTGGNSLFYLSTPPPCRLRCGL